MLGRCWVTVWSYFGIKTTFCGTKRGRNRKRNGNETEQEASKKKSALPVPCRVRFMKILVFPKEFQGFLVSEALQVGVYVRPRFMRFQDGFWTNFGRLSGGQDAPQDAPGRRQDGPRWRQDVPKTAKNGPKTPLRRVTMHPSGLKMQKCWNFKKY